ncbi:hypothetical protein RJT34_12973 [Clitoria ternatea]|uniref:Uncharacterized protein n=1 Tax=Clitoria ternatea TaxID=43366 RepID=A0AAN9JR94_CLITE
MRISKAYAGLNGMKLGGEVLTVVQAMPDASPLESASKPASYVMPEHAKPLLRKPTEVLKNKNVFAADSISSLSDMAMEEILEAVRLECASIIQECPDQHDTHGPEFHGKMVAIDIDVDVKNMMVGDNVHSDNRDCVIQEGFSEQDTSSELVGPKKGIDEEDDIFGNVFEPGSILVEYGRAKACCSAAHCLHGGFFEDRMVTVEYVALSLYRARFTN